MAHINLLPWREALNKERKRQFAVMVAGSALFSVLALIYVHMHISNMITNQEARNKFLETKIQEVEKQITEIETLETDKRNLLSRMQIIQTLQGSRPEIVHLFQEIAQIMPEGVYLTQVSVAGSNIKVEGVAESNANVSALMRNIDTAAWMARPVLDVIDSSKSDYAGMSWFSLRVAQNRPAPVPANDKDKTTAATSSGAEGTKP